VSAVEAKPGRAFEALSDAVLAIAAERSVEPILQRLVEAARELVDAEYAALGVPDGHGGFAQFLTAGMSDELVESLGPLPRTHGLLGAMLEAPAPYRIDDVQRDPRFRGWWPSHHPNMRSFLGVPIVARGAIVGAFYLTDKLGAAAFDAGDQELIETFAAHAAVALENARLYEASRELSIVEERNRLARELHDSVTQRLFALRLTGEAAADLLERDVAAARTQLERLHELTGEAIEELRAVILALRPATIESEGLAATLAKHVDLLRRAYGREIRLELAGRPEPPPAAATEVLRIAQEALQNALRHSGAERFTVSLEARGGSIVLRVEDEGEGFDSDALAVRSRRLGLTSMEERARELGGTLAIDSLPGRGTTVRLEAPL
jgi:signal transduction histidine kinase